MMKSILGTAALLAGWSLVWFVNVVYLNQDIGHPPYSGVQESDDGPLDIAIWVIGLVAIVGIQALLYRSSRSRPG